MLAAGSPRPSHSSLYDNAVAILRERYFDKNFRETRLDELARRYRPCATEAKEINAQRDCLLRLLSQIPASHLSVFSEESFNYLVGELTGKNQPTFGLLAMRIGDDYFTSFVLEGGPAAQAGILPWERIVSIDGQPTARSPRLDYPQKDAYLSVDRDPPMHLILCHDGDEVTLVLERAPNEQRSVTLRALPYSALEAARTSARVMNLSGHQIGYVHFWFVHSTGVLESLHELFANQFSTAEGLVLDLRGRGGNGVVVDQLMKLLGDWARPIVALTDRQSRSAKDAIAYEFKQRHLATVVGERTAGAVVPASFAPIGDKTMLMFPSFTLGEYTEKLELKGGVEPDIFVERSGPYSAGRDPIMKRGMIELLALVRQEPLRERTQRPLAEPVLPSTNDSVQELPALDSLINKMVDSLGGEKVLRAHKHRTLHGKTELVGLPMKGDFMQKASAPDKSLVSMNLGDLRIRQGCDGTTAWMETSMNGLQILSGAMADAVKQQAKFYGPLDLVEGNKEVTPTAFASFDNKECIELKLVGPSDGVSYLYVEVASGLIAGTKATIETPIGLVESRTYLRDYKELNGYKTATEIFIESSVQRQLIKIENVTFDPIAPEEYAVPKSTR